MKHAAKCFIKIICYIITLKECTLELKTKIAIYNIEVKEVVYEEEVAKVLPRYQGITFIRWRWIRRLRFMWSLARNMFQ